MAGLLRIREWRILATSWSLTAVNEKRELASRHGLGTVCVFSVLPVSEFSYTTIRVESHTLEFPRFNGYIGACEGGTTLYPLPKALTRPLKRGNSTGPPEAVLDWALPQLLNQRSSTLDSRDTRGMPNPGRGDSLALSPQ